MLDALEDLGVAEPWRLAEPLAAAGIDGAWLEHVAALAGPATGAALRWVAASLTARAARRRAARVDRAHERPRRRRSSPTPTWTAAASSRSTSTRAWRRRSPSSATSSSTPRSRSCATTTATCRKLTVHGSELNQVWTNLLDNAIDALGEHGHDHAHARAATATACASTSPTTAPASRRTSLDRIFDPFFTTKDVGQGTGLGLDTARRIVAERHNGTLGFDTGPGAGTTFHVWLPYRGHGALISAAAMSAQGDVARREPPARLSPHARGPRPRRHGGGLDLAWRV